MTSDTSTAPLPVSPPRHGGQVGRLGLALLVAVTLGLLFMLANLYALSSPEPRDVPVGVVGPPEAAAQVQAGLDERAPDGFEVSRLADEEAARQAITDRELAAVLVLPPPGDAGAEAPEAAAATVLTTSATGGTSEAVTGALSGAAVAATGAEPQVEDVVPAPGDPRGLVLAQLVFGSAIAGLAYAGVAYASARRAPLGWRLVTPLVFAAVLGLGAAWAGDVVFDGVTGDFWGLALAMGLLGLAVAAVAAGLGRLAGPVGFFLVGLTVIWVGNGSSGASVAREFLPTGYREVSPWLPNGAAVDAVRGFAYFDGAGVAEALTVLGIWVGAGYALMLLAAALGRGQQRA